MPLVFGKLDKVNVTNPFLVEIFLLFTTVILEAA
jgi:hypothetical protein